jgi:hypothetical protein
MDLEYYYVAFVDILGFSEMVRLDCHAGNKGPQFLPRIKDALTETRDKLPSGEFRAIQFSDSIILSRKFSSDKMVFKQFLEAVGSLQLMLFKKEILCRGGVAHGKHTERDDILFSQALVEAYRIESSMAQNPRVLVSADLMELFKPTELPIVTDRDGYSFVNYLKGSEQSLVQEALTNIENLPAPTANISAKIRWLSDYCKLIHPDISSSSKSDMVCH